jgi:uncharacterized protein YuzE
LAKCVPRAIPPGPILTCVSNDILYLGLGHPMPVDMREAGVGVDVVAKVHNRALRDEAVQCQSTKSRDRRRVFVNLEGKGTVDKLRVYFDREGNTLSVWFDDPKKEHVCEESDDDVVLMKDRRGRVIGFERLNFLSDKQKKEGVRAPVEVHMD